MQFGAAVTEYILPGLPITAILAYGLDCASGGHLAQRLSPQLTSPAALTALGLVFLSIAYMLGILVHFVARKALLDIHRGVEVQTWRQYGILCSPAALEALGAEAAGIASPAGSGLPARPGALSGGSADSLPRGSAIATELREGQLPEQDPGWAGWTLWRMRLFLCHRSPQCANEILKLQAVSRATRGAFALPVSLAIWLATDLGQIRCQGHVIRVPLLLTIGGLCVALWYLVRRTYSYRWGVVCRGSIAAFLVACTDYGQRGRDSMP